MKIKDSTKQNFSFPVLGMHCASCAQLISTRITALPGVSDVKVSYAAEQLQFSGKHEDIAQVNKSLHELGYALQINDQDLSQEADAIKADTANDDAWLVVMPIAILSFLTMLYELAAQQIWWLPPIPIPMPIMQFSWWLAATYTLLVPGKQFLSALKRFVVLRVANMDTLIGIGAITAYSYSTLALFFPQQFLNYSLPIYFYFDVAVVVIGFVLFGKYLESIMKFKTQSALESLIALQVKKAIVVTKTGEIETNIENIKRGDTIKVKSGEKIPLDGVVVDGESTIDESLMTGESLPVNKTIGSKVLGGSLNQAGMLLIRVEAVGEESFLQQIIQSVKTAQMTKAPIERVTDMVARHFVPAVMVVALLSLIGWILWGKYMGLSTVHLAIQAFVGVLVIACPCALGLATPAAMVVAMGRAAQYGVLLKDATTVERLTKISTIVLDKTGTLTSGSPGLVGIHRYTDLTEAQILTIAAALESTSTHPLATAITRAAQKKKLPQLTAKKIDLQTSLGVMGTINTKRYWIGGIQMLRKMQAKIPTDHQVDPGTMLLHLGTNKTVLATIAVRDQLKATAHTAMSSLRQMGLEVIMLSGDQKTTAMAIANQAGIQNVIAEVTPQQKLAQIKQLQDAGKMVVMVGDGINDAPALAQADIGMAMSTGSDSAIATANVTILHGDLDKVVFALRMARTTMKVVRQNLYWAFLYNVVGIPLAAGWLYPVFGWFLNPVFAGLAMALSSVSVVFNSLRLRGLRPEKALSFPR